MEAADGESSQCNEKTVMKNPYFIVKEFEDAMAEYTNAPYTVALESCSAALFLCCKYVDVSKIDEVIIPKYTYPSVPAAIINAGGRVKFKDIDWQKEGYYYLQNTNIVDSAKRLSRNMYKEGTLTCLSFHGKKCLGIGRGGMILTASEKSINWFQRMRFDGRGQCALYNDTLAMVGWNFYLTLEQAARGLELLQWLPDENIAAPDPYTDLSQYKFFTEANRK